MNKDSIGFGVLLALLAFGFTAEAVSLLLRGNAGWLLFAPIAFIFGEGAMSNLKRTRHEGR